MPKRRFLTFGLNNEERAAGLRSSCATDHARRTIDAGPSVANHRRERGHLDPAMRSPHLR
eukprot:3477157-Pyramimonas_sp.AAC.1